jgi:hypothetical protein
MPVESNDGGFEPSPEYFASLIVAILRRFKLPEITLTMGDLKETAPLGMHIEVAKDGQSLKIEVINSEGSTPVETFVGLDFASYSMPDPSKLN